MNIQNLKGYSLVSQEFFYRSFYFLGCIFFSGRSCWIYGKELVFLYLDPLLQLHQNCMYTSISEAFYTTLYLCIWSSLTLSLPYAFYQILCFFLPSLFPEEGHKIATIFLYCLIPYYLSIVLCRIYIIPELCSWFLKFGISKGGLYLSLQARVSTFFSWTLKVYLLCLGLGLLPIGFLILEVFFSAPGFKILALNRKYRTIFVLLVSACISPPDVFSQFVLFSFCTLLCEWVLWLSFRALETIGAGGDFMREDEDLRGVPRAT